MNKKKKGFTIVELVVVIAVIGILSAILIPTFSNLITKSREKGLQLGLRNAYEEYAILAEEDALAQDKVMLCEKAEPAEGDKVYKLNTANGVWEENAEEGTYTLVEVAGHEGAFNGYYVFTFVAAEANQEAGD